MLLSDVQLQLRQACEGKLCLEIYYEKGTGEKKRYEIVPVSIRSKGGSTMLYGYDMSGSATKAFKIDRILEVNPMVRKPWPQDIKEKVGFPLELETSKEPVPQGTGIKLRPIQSQ
jgi:predicted DNA-binding transcriptional regulator YafY